MRGPSGDGAVQFIGKYKEGLALLRVPTSEFQRNIERYQEIAQREPVALVDGESNRCVVISTEEYNRLKRRDRRVLAIEEMTEEQAALVAAARVPPGYEHLDAELEGWEP
jgi:PHD/YefM family antitoxin component YafN of YafNO toxin-antitoxin module